MPTSRRIARFRETLAQRLGHVCVAIEALYHRHNVSAVMRTCDAMGIHHVHLVHGGFEPSHGTARGSERWLGLHHHADAQTAIDAIRADGFQIWVADLADDAYTPETLPLDQPACIWFGNELVGVSEVARAAADGVVHIPQYGMAQSLNVSVAAAMVLRSVAERARAQPDALLSESERAAIDAEWLQG